MKSSAALLLPLAILSGSAVAGDNSNTWEQWSSTPAPVAECKTEYKTIYNTVTSYEKVTETVTNYQTVTETQVSTNVETVTETETQVATETVPVAGPATTITQVNSVTVTVTESGAAVTVTSVAVSVGTETVQETVQVTVVDTATITSVDEVTVTASCSISLSGLVTCPSRIINPTYTPPAPLPTNYLWGCPPGSLCHPKRENCNFEQNPPAESYVCAPEECLPVADIPPYETWSIPEEEARNDTCAWLTPIDDYFNINPLFFDLDFGIFNIYGQPTCTPVVPPSTETVVQTVTIATTVVEGTTVEVPVPQPTTVVEGTTIQVPVPTTVIEGTTVQVPVPTTIVQITTVTIKEPIPVKESTSSTWGAWGSSPAEPHVTKRADLSERHLAERQAPVVGPACYQPCDYAAAVYQSVGKDSACDPNGPYTTAFRRVTDCTKANAATGATSVASVLAQAAVYCRTHPFTKRDLPAFRFARG